MKIYNFLNSDLNFDELWQKMVIEYKFWDKKCFGELFCTSLDQKDGTIVVQNAKQEPSPKQF